MRSREIRLKSRPEGAPGPETFELAEVEVPSPAPGEVLVRNRWMSVDPYMRSRMIDRPSYVPPFQIGEPLEGGAVGEVVASASQDFTPGDTVMSMLGWREAFTAPAKHLTKLDRRGLPEQTFLGAAGMPGLTAWVGLLKIAQVEQGDMVFVSGAAGAVGSVACQIAKAKGCTVIGSAGGAAKLEFLREIGVDHGIDYQEELDLAAALARVAPKGIDVYFDNVGGDHLEAALSAARPFARFALCGAISQYNDLQAAPGPKNLFFVIGKRLKMQGFIVSDHQAEAPNFLRELSGWVGAGKLKWRETVDHGIEAAPGAFSKLFTGGNVGKMLVKLGD